MPPGRILKTTCLRPWGLLSDISDIISITGTHIKHHPVGPLYIFYGPTRNQIKTTISPPEGFIGGSFPHESGTYLEKSPFMSNSVDAFINSWKFACQVEKR
jgi:hypothetical protein